MTTPVQNISGIFIIDVQTIITRISWGIAIPIALAILAGGVMLAIEIYKDPNPGSSKPSEILVVAFFLILFLFVFPLGALIHAVSKIFQKPGVYLTGVRANDTGFETGTYTVDLASIDRRINWEKAPSGKIPPGSWMPDGKAVNGDSIEAVVSFSESKENPRHFSLQGFLFRTKDNVIYQSPGATKSRLVTVLDGSFKLVGAREESVCLAIFQPLESIANVLSSCRSVSPPACALNIASEKANTLMASMGSLMPVAALPAVFI